jgi:sulfotransferase
VPDLPKAVQERLYFLRFEDLVAQPVACMSHLYSWLQLAPHEINPQKLSKGIQESDSHYHMKYLHRQSTHINAPKPHDIPPRIQAQIETAYAWFYQTYYPKVKG